MRLQDRLDAFKRDFEVWKARLQALQGGPRCHASGHRRADRERPGGPRLRSPATRRRTSRSAIPRESRSPRTTFSPRGRWWFPSIAASGAPIATWSCRRSRRHSRDQGARRQPRGDLAADAAQQPQIAARRTSSLPDPERREARSRRPSASASRCRTIWSSSTRASRTTCRRSTTILLDPADAGALRDRQGWRDRLCRGEP